MENIRPYRTFRYSQRFRNFRVRIPFSIKHRDCDPLAFCQPGQRLGQSLPEQGPVGIVIRSPMLVGGGRRQLLGVADHPAPSQITCRIEHDPHEPWPERARRIEPVDGTPRRQKAVLGRIVSVMLVAEQGPGDAPRGWGISLHQLAERVSVALSRPVGKFGVGHI